MHRWLSPLLADVGAATWQADAGGFVLALAIITFLHLVIGEMAPKSWAISHPELSARLLALPMRGFMWVARPLLRALSEAANRCPRLIGVEALLARLETERDLHCVIVHKVDRLARNRHDDATITYALHEAEVELVSVTENIDRTPVGRFMHAIVAANAEFYSANLAAEAMKGLVQKAKSGGTPTRAPIGYLNVRKLFDGRELKTVEIDPERAPHVRWAFAAYGSGAYTLDTLLAALTERGLRTRPTAKKPEKALSRSQLAVMLRNPYHVGVVRYAGVEYEGRHEPLIDEATFAKAKAVLAAHNSSAEKDRKHHHYLKGSLYCGRCGSRMSLTYAKGNGGRYAYFYCLGRTRGTGCKQP